MVKKEWRSAITDLLVPECGYYYLVYDPDYLFGDESLFVQLKEKGFEILAYTGEIDFRLLFEEKIRSSTDRGIHKELIILDHAGRESLYIPYDLEVTCTPITVDLAWLVPSLDHEALKDIPVTRLDELYSDEYGHTRKRLSYDESSSLLLRKLYGIDPLLIHKDVHLFRFLLHIHYDRPDISEPLLIFMSDQLKEKREFGKWDIELLTHNRDAFFRFLEEKINNNEAGDLPLEHSEVKVYLDNLVQDGLIHVTGGKRNQKPDARNLEKSVESLAANLPETHTEWLAFSRKWAGAVSSIYTEFHPETNSELYTALNRTKKSVNLRFGTWLEKSYASLYNHPPSSPVMLHHVPRYLFQKIASGKKVALLVIDGLSLSQWKVIRNSLQQHPGCSYSIDEKALFAWIPTLTSVSRQALLSGKIPLLISRSLYGTQGEEKLWKNFWEDNDLAPSLAGYCKMHGDLHELGEVTELLRNPFQVAAVIVDKIDSIMHGQKQGSAMMHKEVRHWADSSFLSALLDTLFHHYDEIFLTSDHGNDEAEGIGKFAQGSLIREKGQRCRIYNEQQFRQEAQEAYPDAIPWPQTGLPQNYYPLLAPYGKAFTAEDDRVVTHGGASLDEVIVPFIRFTREGR